MITEMINTGNVVSFSHTDASAPTTWAAKRMKLPVTCAENVSLPATKVVVSQYPATADSREVSLLILPVEGNRLTVSVFVSIVFILKSKTGTPQGSPKRCIVIDRKLA